MINPFEAIFGIGGPKPPFRIAIIGGTFGPLHDGHKFLFKSGLLVSDSLVIGVTNDTMAQEKDNDMPDFESRFWGVKHYMDSITDFRHYQVVPIDSPHGMAITMEQAELIICSDEEDVVKRVREINVERRAMKIHELLILVIPRVRDLKGEVISSTRIRKGELSSERQIEEPNL